MFQIWHLNDAHSISNIKRPWCSVACILILIHKKKWPPPKYIKRLHTKYIYKVHVYKVHLNSIAYTTLGLMNRRIVK